MFLSRQMGLAGGEVDSSMDEGALTVLLYALTALNITL